MIATSGLTGSATSPSAVLQSSLESRLRVLTGSRGSTLFALTWKHRTTPSGRPICALRASARRTSASGCTSWPTPTTRDHKDGDAQSCANVPINALLGRAVHLASWPSPAASDGDGGKGPRTGVSMTGRMPDGSKATMDLSAVAKLGMDHQTPARRTATGEMRIGSSAEMASGGQLNPAHSRWLMGLPLEWDACGVAAMPSSRKSRRRLSKPTSMREAA